MRVILHLALPVSIGNVRQCTGELGAIRKIHDAKSLVIARVTAIVNWSQYIRNFRKTRTGLPRGESQQAFALRCALSIDWVKSIENGRVSLPPPQTIDLLARQLGVPLAELQALDPIPLKQPPRRVTIPADLWAELDRGADLAGMSPQDYAVTLLRRVLEMPERTAKSSQQRGPGARALPKGSSAESTPDVQRGQSRPAKKDQASA
jgi:transcriptional regulator with XRE-family HTH domain